MRATCIGRSLEWRTINSFVHKIRLDDRRAKKRLQPSWSKTTAPSAGWTILRDLPPVWPLLACPRARRLEKWEDDTHIDRLGGGAFNGHLLDFSLYLFCTLLMVICCEHKVVQHFHVKCIQNLLQIDGPGRRFSARRRSEVLISRATGGVWIILILVQNDPEKTKTKNKTKQKKNISVFAPPRLRRRLPFRDVPMT